MALKPLRKVIADDMQFRCNNAASRGALVVYASTAGEVALPPQDTITTTVPSGSKVAGVLLQDVVNIANPSLMGRLTDPLGTTDRPRNLNKLETHISGQVQLLKLGWVQTDKWDHTNPTIGATVYVTHSGLFSSTQVGTAYNSVGHAMSRKDSDGYVKVWVNIS